MKIFFGTSGIGRYGELLTEGLCKSGCTVDLCDSRPHRTVTYTTPKYDISSLRKRFFKGVGISNTGHPYAMHSDDFIHFIESYDAFIFWFADSIFPALLDLPILNMLGKRALYCSAGDDTIYAPIEQYRREWRSRNHLHMMTLDQHKEQRDISEIASKWFSNYNTLVRKLYTYRMFESYDFPLLLCSGCSGLAKKPYVRTTYKICDPLLTRLGSTKAQEFPRYPIVARHYTTNTTTKDSSVFTKISKNSRIVRLARDGLLQLEIRQSIRQDDFFKDLLEADILLDQLAAIGGISWEAACFAIPAFTGPEYDGLVNSEYMLESIQCWNPEQVVDVLEHLTLNLEFLHSRKKSVYRNALNLSPARQGERFYQLIKNGIADWVEEPWGSRELDNQYKRLGIESSLVSQLEDTDIGESMLKAYMSSR